MHFKILKIKKIYLSIGKYQNWDLRYIAAKNTYLFIYYISVFVFTHNTIIIIKEKSVFIYKFKRLIYTMNIYENTKMGNSYHLVTQNTYKLKLYCVHNRNISISI